MLGQGQVHVGEFQAEEAAPGFQHAPSLAQGLGDVRHIANAKSNGVGVEALVGEGKGFRVAHGEINLSGKTFSLATGFSLRHHLWRNIGDGDTGV